MIWQARALLGVFTLWLALALAGSALADDGAAQSPTPLLQFSGQHRLLYGQASAADLGLGPRQPPGSGLLLSRNLFGLTLSFSSQLQLVTQLGAHFAFGEPGALPPDADYGDVHLLFLEWRRPALKALRTDLQLRVGRQELPLGSTRWFSTRDGTNVRQAFDMLRLTLSNARVAAHGFAALVPRLHVGFLDDAPELASRLFGGYVTWHVLPEKRLSLDLFLVARHRPRTLYQEHAGRELRRTSGLRLFGELPCGLEYIVHALAQWGSLDQATVRAWGVAAALWQRVTPAPYELRIGLRTDVLSGDGRRADQTVGTFHPLFPNQAFFATQPAIYPANVVDVHPLLKLGLRRLELELGCALFFRQRVSDAVYGAAGQPLFWGEQSRAAFTGVQPSAELLYKPTQQLTFMLAYAFLLAGPGLRGAGGDDVHFAAGSAAYAY